MVEFNKIVSGDHVSLRSTRVPTTKLSGLVKNTADNALYIDGHGWVNTTNWHLTKVVPGPKLPPLPDEDGLYTSEPGRVNGTLYMRLTGNWSADDGGQWSRIDERDIPRNLVKLVPGDVVATVRSALIFDIINELRHNGYVRSATVISQKFGEKS